MDSIKVLVGNPTLASEYNKLRKDALFAQYYPIDTVDNDDTFIVENEIVGDYNVVNFAGSAKSTCYFDLMMNDAIATDEDLLIHIAFDMNSTEAAKQVEFELKYTVVDDGGDTTTTSTTLTEIVSTPNTLDTLESLTLSTIKIPAASIAAGSIISLQFSRLGSGVNDTHTGDLRLFELILYQLQS